LWGIAFSPESSDSWSLVIFEVARGFERNLSAGLFSRTTSLRWGSFWRSQLIVRSLAGTPMSPPSIGVASKVTFFAGAARSTGNCEAYARSSQLARSFGPCWRSQNSGR